MIDFSQRDFNFSQGLPSLAMRQYFVRHGLTLTEPSWNFVKRNREHYAETTDYVCVSKNDIDKADDGIELVYATSQFDGLLNFNFLHETKARHVGLLAAKTEGNPPYSYKASMVTVFSFKSVAEAVEFKLRYVGN